MEPKFEKMQKLNERKVYLTLSTASSPRIPNPSAYYITYVFVKFPVLSFLLAEFRLLESRDLWLIDETPKNLK